MENHILIAYSRTDWYFVSRLADHCMIRGVHIRLWDISSFDERPKDFKKYQSLIIVFSPRSLHEADLSSFIIRKNLARCSPDDREVLNEILLLFKKEMSPFVRIEIFPPLTTNSTWIVFLEPIHHDCFSQIIKPGSEVRQQYMLDSKVRDQCMLDSAVRQPDMHSLGIIDYIKDSWEKLPTGRIIYNPPSKMRVAVTERIETRIAKYVTDELIKGLKGRGEIQIEALKVSTRMIAELKGDKFKIESLFSDKEMAIKPDYTQWEWDVTPIERGLHKLKLCVDAVIEISHLQDSTIHLAVLEKEISVMVNPRYEVETFVRTHIKWIVTTIIGSIGIFIAYLAYLKPK